MIAHKTGGHATAADLIEKAIAVNPQLARRPALLRQASISWVSLQFGDPEELQRQVAGTGAFVRIDGAVDQFQDVDAFATQIAAMDLVITIDNSTAHLAGALGIPSGCSYPSHATGVGSACATTAHGIKACESSGSRSPAIGPPCCGR